VAALLRWARCLVTAVLPSIKPPGQRLRGPGRHNKNNPSHAAPSASGAVCRDLLLCVCCSVVLVVCLWCWE
jgi:hypothetical protein